MDLIGNLAKLIQYFCALTIGFHVFEGNGLRTRPDFFKNVTYSVTNKTVTEGVQTAIDGFEEGFLGFEKETCLRFQALEPENFTAKIRLTPRYLKPDEKGVHCSASGANPPTLRGGINIFEFCTGSSITYHETGHALGMIHTQRRFDRDDYITVDVDNINDGDVGAYNPKTEYGYNLPYDDSIQYDFGSIMHYSPNTFAKNPDKPIMESKDPLYQHTMGRAWYPSFLDIVGWNKGFKCDCVPKEQSNSILGLTGILIEKYCRNGGYPDPNNCGRCKCPKGFEGHICQDPEGLSNSNNTDCGERIVQANSGREWQVFERNQTWDGVPLNCAWHFKGFNGDKVEIRAMTITPATWSGNLLEIKTGRNVSLQDQKRPNWRLTGYQFRSYTEMEKLAESLAENPIVSVSERLIVILDGPYWTNVRLEYRSEAYRFSPGLKLASLSLVLLALKFVSYS